MSEQEYCNSALQIQLSLHLSTENSGQICAGFRVNCLMQSVGLSEIKSRHGARRLKIEQEWGLQTISLPKQCNRVQRPHSKFEAWNMILRSTTHLLALTTGG